MLSRRRAGAPVPHHDHGREEEEEEEEERETRAQPEPNKKQTDLGEKTTLASLLTDVDTKRIVPKHRNKNQGQESH